MKLRHRPPHLHPDNSSFFLTGRIYGGFSYLTPKRTKEYFLEKIHSILEKYKVNLSAWTILNNHYHFLIESTKGKLISPFMRELHGATAHFIKENLPPLMTEHGQRLTKEVTPWDARQIKRLEFEEKQLERELKFANTEKKRINVLAQFIARHKNHLDKNLYRGLKSAITKGYLTDSLMITSLTAKQTPIWYQYTDHVIRDDKDYFQHLNYLHQNPVKHGYIKKISDYEFSSIHQFLREKGEEWLVDCFREYPIIDFQPTGIVD